MERAGGFEEVSKLMRNKQNIEEYQGRKMTVVVGRHQKLSVPSFHCDVTMTPKQSAIDDVTTEET